MKDGLRRVLTALVLLPLLYVIIRMAPPEGFFLLVAAVILTGQYEFYRLYYPRNHSGRIFIGLVMGISVAFGFYLHSIPVGGYALMLILTLVVMGGMLFTLFSVQELHRILSDSAVTFLGVAYVSFLLSHLLFLRGLSEGEYLILFVLGITWLGDAGAYYTGSLLGRRPLAARISPRKTVEGSLGGLGVGVLGSLGAKFWFLPQLSVWDAVVLGLVLGIVGQLGDLVESLCKRSAGVKDSGQLIAAHGGVLDKVDALMFTAPVFYYYLVIVKQYSQPVMI